MPSINGNEFLFWSLERLSAAISNKQVSPVEVTQQLLNRIETVDKTINSFITVAKEQALASASQVEKDVVSGNRKGPLQGVPIGLKDLIFTKEIKTTMGSEIYKDFLPHYNATVVDKLQNAGAIIIGKLNTHQFAYGPTGDRSFYGAVKNPYDTSKITGGSSSGSAASVAAYMGYASLGSDTSGSVRIPASMCGLVGMKPTFGRVSKYGVFPLSSTLDHIGPMTRTIVDNAFVLNAIAGYDQNDEQSVRTEHEDFTRNLHRGIKGLVIGVPTSFFFDNLEPEVAEQIQSALKVFEYLGAQVIEIDIPNIEQIWDAQQTVLKYDAYNLHAQRMEDFPALWDEEVRERLLAGSTTKKSEFLRALEYRKTAINEFNDVFNQVDVMITPTIPILPTNIGQREVNLSGYNNQHVRVPLIRLTGPINFTGFPSLSMPCGLSSSGLPIGLQLIGKPFKEALLYQFGYALEQEHANQTSISPNKILNILS